MITGDQPRTFSDLIVMWPTMPTLARDLRLSRNTVAAWQRRASIPPRYWDDVIRSAEQHGIRGVTRDLLHDLATSKPA